MMPNPRSLILNLLLATDSQCLSAREAVASCALFGISENSVRVTLARLAHRRGARVRLAGGMGWGLRRSAGTQ